MLGYPKRTSTNKQAPMRRRVGLFIFAVFLIIAIIILFHVCISLLTLEAEVEITASSLRSNGGLATNYRRVSVDVSLYNPGHRRRATVWTEITNQPTNVSFSKTQYIQIGYRQSKTITIEFTLDSLIYYGEFTHRVWLTYPNSQD